MTQMRRREDWPERLAASTKAAMARPFGWGTWDCLIFTADTILAITDTDPVPDIRGQYHDEAGAALQIARFGADVGRIWDAKLGARIKPAFARRGDVLLTVDANPCGGICTGTHGLFVTERGLARIAALACAAAWRVG